MKDLREDCYFYYELQEMGAYVPNCSYDKYEYGYCPCNENCKHYISKTDVHKLVKTLVRCENCRHAEVSPSGLIKCRGIFRSKEWFCADGLRKEE